MFDKKQKLFTYVLTANTLNIVESYGVTAVALKLTAGAGSYLGTKSLGAINSVAIPLVVNEAVTLTSEQTKYIDELLIDASAGVIEIIAR